MGAARKVKRYTKVKRIIGQRDSRLKKNQQQAEVEAKRKASTNGELVREM